MVNSQCGRVCWDAGWNAFHASQIVAFSIFHLTFLSAVAILRARKHRSGQINQEQSNNFELFAP